MVKRVSITGPESTGKSWLANELGRVYDCPVVDEYARKYFENKEYTYFQEDLDLIVDGQISNELSAINENKSLLFCDTDILTVKIWSLVKYDRVSRHINKLLDDHVYDLYLLCNLDVDWQPEPMRKNEHNRQYIFDLFVKELEQRKFNFAIVEGIGNQRLQNAVNILNNNFS